MRWDVIGEESSIEATGRSSVHPITARGRPVEGSLTTDAEGRLTAGEIRVRVRDLRTGNPLYDREFDGRLDARNHPDIVARLTAAEGDADHPQATGTVEVRGESTEEQGTIEVQRDGEELVVRGEHRFDIRDFGMKPPGC